MGNLIRSTVLMTLHGLEITQTHECVRGLSEGLRHHGVDALRNYFATDRIQNSRGNCGITTAGMT